MLKINFIYFSTLDMKKLIKWFFIFSIIWIWFINFYTNADDVTIDGYTILPALDSDDIRIVNEANERIAESPQHVMKQYNEEANKLTTEQQLASWIMNWNTIMNYIVYVVKFLSQIWLAIGAIFIMYAWYQYMLSVFSWKNAPSGTIKNAIIWVFIVIFSYAILKAMMSLVWLS